MRLKISYQEPHRLNALYGWRAVLCSIGCHFYRRMAVWQERSSWWQHECKHCGHIEWFRVKGGRRMGEEMFPNLRLTSKQGGREYSKDLL
jgi:hypothetical protein